MPTFKFHVNERFKKKMARQLKWAKVAYYTCIFPSHRCRIGQRIVKFSIDIYNYTIRKIKCKESLKHSHCFYNACNSYCSMIEIKVVFQRRFKLTLQTRKCAYYSSIILTKIESLICLKLCWA